MRHEVKSEATAAILYPQQVVGVKLQHKLVSHKSIETFENYENMFLYIIGIAFFFQVTLLAPPYGTCRDDPSYTHTGCREKCEADYIISQCQCKDYRMINGRAYNMCSQVSY